MSSLHAFTLTSRPKRSSPPRACWVPGQEWKRGSSENSTQAGRCEPRQTQQHRSRDLLGVCQTSGNSPSPNQSIIPQLKSAKALPSITTLNPKIKAKWYGKFLTQYTVFLFFIAGGTEIALVLGVWLRYFGCGVGQGVSVSRTSLSRAKAPVPAK